MKFLSIRMLAIAWLGFCAGPAYAGSAFLHPDMPGYEQSQYESYMACAGRFSAKQDLLARITSKLDDRFDAYIRSSFDKGVPLNAMFGGVVEDIKSMPGTLDHAAGELAFQTGGSLFSDAKDKSATSQYNLFRANATVSPECIEHYKLAKTVVLTWKAIEENIRTGKIPKP